jgi:hypothetical protein
MPSDDMASSRCMMETLGTCAMGGDRWRRVEGRPAAQCGGQLQGMMQC